MSHYNTLSQYLHMIQIEDKTLDSGSITYLASGVGIELKSENFQKKDPNILEAKNSNAWISQLWSYDEGKGYGKLSYKKIKQEDGQLFPEGNCFSEFDCTKENNLGYTQGFLVEPGDDGFPKLFENIVTVNAA